MLSLVHTLRSMNLPADFRDFGRCGSPFANWVFPGKLICGPYPGLDGINFPTVTDAVDNLEALVSIDQVNTFVCLQSELPPQDPNVPGSTQHVIYFPKYENYAYTLAQRMGRKFVTYLHMPMDDQTTPSHADFLKNIIQLLHLLNDPSRVVYIHCAGGHGRTGLYIACLLIAIKNMCSKEALYTTQLAHNTRVKHDRKVPHNYPSLSPSTELQCDFVRAFSGFWTFYQHGVGYIA